MTALDRECRICGCTDMSACRHDDGTPCSWIDDDLCSSCDEKLPEIIAKLLAAASQFAHAAADCADYLREPGRSLLAENVVDGDTTAIAIDGLRLLLEATGRTDGALYAAVAKEVAS